MLWTPHHTEGFDLALMKDNIANKQKGGIKIKVVNVSYNYKYQKR
jgi:hypothetical protein